MLLYVALTDDDLSPLTAWVEIEFDPCVEGHLHQKPGVAQMMCMKTGAATRMHVLSYDDDSATVAAPVLPRPVNMTAGSKVLLTDYTIDLTTPPSPQ